MKLLKRILLFYHKKEGKGKEEGEKRIPFDLSKNIVSRMYASSRVY